MLVLEEGWFVISVILCIVAIDLVHSIMYNAAVVCYTDICSMVCCYYEY